MVAAQWRGGVGYLPPASAEGRTGWAVQIMGASPSMDALPVLCAIAPCAVHPPPPPHPPHLLRDLVLHGLKVSRGHGLQDGGGADVGGQDDYRVLEVDHAALPAGGGWGGGGCSQQSIAVMSITIIKEWANLGWPKRQEARQKDDQGMRALRQLTGAGGWRWRDIRPAATARPCLRVGDASVVQDLQQDVEHVAVRLLHLVKQDDGVGAAPAGGAMEEAREQEQARWGQGVQGAGVH